MTMLFRDLFFSGLALFNVGIAAAMLLMPGWTGSWLPWDDLAPLSYAFLIAISAATGAAIVWIVASREYGAAAGGALDLTVAYGTIAAYLFAFRAEMPAGALFWFGVLSVGSGLTVVIIFLWSRRLPIALSRPMPVLLRAFFAACAAAFTLAGLGLLLGWPNVMPWAVEPDFAPILGGLMLGAATYMTYGTVFPVWANAEVQLTSFLVFDLLFLPTLVASATLEPATVVSTIVTSVVVLSSLCLSVWFLILRPLARNVPQLYGAQNI